jgi:prepilin-type N-terminal cleavage/methylation domain-containing protein
MKNNYPIKKQIQKGFTLVELLIVVIILAILAAIVVPQFASTTTDAKNSSLDSTLANMRGAIDLYYQQHAIYPGLNTAVAANCTGGTPGTGTGGTGVTAAQAFLDQLSMYTDASGKACSIGDTTIFKYGPYLKKNALPANPITSSNALNVVSTGNLVMTGATGTALGWKYDNKSGKFIADDAVNVDANSKTYDTH